MIHNKVKPGVDETCVLLRKEDQIMLTQQGSDDAEQLPKVLGGNRQDKGDR